MKAIKSLLIVLSILIVKCSIAQIKFQKTSGGTGQEVSSSIQQTSDGGYIIAGLTQSYGAGYSDAYLIKTNANGDTLWTKTYGGTDEDEAYFVQQTTDGGYILTGYAKSFGAGYQDVYLIKTNSNGNLLWSKTYGAAFTDVGRCVQQTTDGGYIIAGTTFLSLAVSNEIYLIKTNASGDTLWTKTFGGTAADQGYSVQQTNDGGYIISGYSNSFGASDEPYLIKTDSNGNLLWSKTYGGPSSEEGYSAQQTTDGGYILTGWTWSFASGGKNILLIKTNSIGDTLWSKIYDTGGDETGRFVRQTTDGGYIVVSDYYLLKTDGSGNVIWTKHYGGGSDYTTSCQEVADGGYIISGGINMGTFVYDLYFIKTDSNGNSGCTENSPAIINTISVAPQVINSAIMVSAGGIVITPATLVGNGSMVTTPCTNVGINDVSAALSMTVSVFPNPFSKDLIIKGTAAKGEIILFDIMGKEIFRTKTFDAETKINTESLLPGFYLLNYNDGNKTANSKLMKF